MQVTIIQIIKLFSTLVVCLAFLATSIYLWKLTLHPVILNMTDPRLGLS